MGFKLNLSKEYLVEEYCVKGRTYEEISKQLKCSKESVIRYAKKYNISSRRSGRKRVNLIGQKFGYLEVIGLDNNRPDKQHPHWLCKCVCGQITSASFSSLRKQKRCWECRNEFISLNKRRGYLEISGEFWCRIQHSAQARNIKVEITLEQIWELFLKQNRKCALSDVDIKFNPRKSDISIATASLDRIDSSKGYTIDNIQWVHKDLQSMKMDFSQEEFIAYCKLVAKNFS